MINDETLESKEKIESDEKINKQANEGMTWSTQQVNKNRKLNLLLKKSSSKIKIKNFI